MFPPAGSFERQAEVIAQAGAGLDPAERDATWAAGAAAPYTEVFETIITALEAASRCELNADELSRAGVQNFLA